MAEACNQNKGAEWRSAMVLVCVCVCVLKVRLIRAATRHSFPWCNFGLGNWLQLWEQKKQDFKGTLQRQAFTLLPFEVFFWSLTATVVVFYFSIFEGCCIALFMNVQM